MKRIRRSKLIGFSAMTMLLLAVACNGGDGASDGDAANEAEGGEFVIGISVDQTNAFAPYELPVLQGAQLAAHELNQDGGILGREVRIEARNNEFDAAQAVQTTQELIDQGVDALIVACENSQAIASGKLAQEAEIPTFSSCNTSVRVPVAVGDYMFVGLFSDNQQASYSAEYACDQGYETVYLLRSPETEYLETTPDYFADAFAENCGGEVVGEDNFETGSEDYSAQVTNIAQSDPQPDLIYSAIYVPDSNTFIRQLRAANVDIPMIGADGNDDASFVEAAGDAAEGFVYTTHGFPEPGSRLADVVDAFEEFHGEPPANAPFTGAGYDQVYLFAAAAEAADSVEPSAIRDALEEIEGLELSLGEYTYGTELEEHAPQKEICLVEIQDLEPTLISCGRPGYIAPFDF